MTVRSYIGTIDEAVWLRREDASDELAVLLEEMPELAEESNVSKEEYACI